MEKVRGNDVQSDKARDGNVAAQNGTHGHIHAKYHIGFRAPLGVVDHKPVHENIGIAALIQSDIHWSSSVRYEDLTNDQWEYMRGLMWPDDPGSFLFLENYNNNHSFDDGVAWYKEYSRNDMRFITRRSHYGDLQFLHAMAPANGEAPQTTKDKFMYWLEVMYKLACGNQGYSESDTLDKAFPGVFGKYTAPALTDTLKDLILGRTTGYKAPNIPIRALGVCMHIISDSFAIGHTQRNLLNPEDLAPRDSNGYIQFKSGTTAKFGSIVAFHNYNGQNEDRHTHYDQLAPNLTLDPNNLSTFNPVFGAKDAISKLTTFLNFYARKAAWADVQKFLADDVFALDPNAQPGNSNVDSGIYLSNGFHPHMKKDIGVLIEKCSHESTREHYQSIHDKIDLVEAGFGQNDKSLQGHSKTLSPCMRWIEDSTKASKMQRLLLCLLAAAALGVLVHRLT